MKCFQFYSIVYIKIKLRKANIFPKNSKMKTAASTTSSNSSNYSSKKRKNLNNNVFHIRLASHIDVSLFQMAQKIDLKDPVFRRILEQEYATKYLESMGVEATNKNIVKILKERPLDSCEIVESRLTGGLHTDTITVITKTELSNVEHTKKNDQMVSNQMLKILDLKKMALKKDTKKTQKPTSQIPLKKQEEIEQNPEHLNFLSFEIKDIKNRYIFPFNQNFSRKSNYRLKDAVNILELEKETSKLIFQASIFHFPFTQIKLSLKILKELQNPISTRFSQISDFLQKFYQNFPQTIFPIKKEIEERKISIADKLSDDYANIPQNPLNEKNIFPKQNIHIAFVKENIDRMFDIIRSEENVKFIGVILHLSYWSVFGGVNPVQIDLGTKKKMFLMISETMQYFELKTENKRIWMNLVQPMILLTLKMALDYFFHKEYPKMFVSEESMKVRANEIAFDKILLFVQKILDQGNINGRLIFLQSDIDGPKGNFIKDKKFIRKRIFGTSPGIHLILPEPKDGRARCIMAKNIQLDQKDGVLDENCQMKINEEDRECREKLLHLALLKIRNRIEDISGGSTEINPIINLIDKE